MSKELFDLPNKTAPAAASTETPAPVAQAAPAPTVNQEPETEPVPAVSELDMLKSRAKLMGIGFSNNISVEALKAKIKAKVDGEEAESISQAQASEPTQAAETPAQKTLSLREQLRKDEMKLVRLRITNMDPKKKDLPGEIFTVANKYLGTVRKFIPYGEVTENGYHVPYFIYRQLKERKFLSIRTRKGKQGPIVETSWVPEFALEILPQLTTKELADLAAAQAAKGGLSD